jgi:hypothetical protein
MERRVWTRSVCWQYIKRILTRKETVNEEAVVDFMLSVARAAMLEICLDSIPLHRRHSEEDDILWADQ